jgi:mono/diheme cytochrome c family protein
MVNRYCISCHRQGKDNNEFWMDSYENILTTGDNGPNVVAGDPNSPLLVVIQGTPIPDPDNPGLELVGVMPPKKHLSTAEIDAWMRWVLMGMPQTAEEAGQLTMPSPTPTPAP